MIKSPSSLLCNLLLLTGSCLNLLTLSDAAVTNGKGEVVRLLTSMAIDSDGDRGDCDKFVNVNGLSSKAAHHVVRSFNECSSIVAANHGIAHNPHYFIDHNSPPNRKLLEIQSKGDGMVSAGNDVTATVTAQRSFLRAHQNLDAKEQGNRDLQLDMCSCVNCASCCDLFEMMCSGCGTVPCGGQGNGLEIELDGTNSGASGVDTTTVPSRTVLEQDMHSICEPYMRNVIDQFLAHTPTPNRCLGTTSSQATFYFDAEAFLGGVWF